MPVAHSSLALHLLRVSAALAAPSAHAPAQAPHTIAVSPATVVGGNPVTATITLGAPAPPGGTQVVLASTNTAVAQLGGRVGLALGTTLVIPAGALTAQIPVRTFGVASRTSVTLKATTLGVTATTTLTVDPASLRTLTLAPPSVVGGTRATATVALDGAAPAGGAAVALRSNNPVATVPASVSVPAGATSATFPIGTAPVAADGRALVVASMGPGTVAGDQANLASSLAQATLIVVAPVPSAVQVAPSSVVAGSAATMRVVLTGVAPRGGLTFALSASSPAARVPPSVTVPAGADRQDVPVATGPVASTQTVTLRAGRLAPAPAVGIADGSSNTISVGEVAAPAGSASATLTITPPPPPVVTVSVQPSPTIGGVPVAVTVSVQPNSSSTGALPSTVALSTDHPELIQLPASAPFPVAFSSGNPTVTVTAPTLAAAVDRSVTITARVGTGTATTTLLVKQTPPPIASFTLRPNPVHGGFNSIAQLAASATLTTGVTVTLTTDHPELVTLPAPFLLSPSSVPTSLTLKTVPTAAPVAVTITASAGAQKVTTTMSVIP